ncbi:formylglycine-generating enzyme family protein [Zunongwangia endophytica]|uniref:Formylglycine-generating enzyme family protein n=1 Tax=Zunongwangia endophytica TaxID=1808945 RepID=A0ABV8H9V2_9FLAO|nr:formylglycine-generating enzyme family protein [Zunongwangia endophytica]MDN3594911.1 formylglycine-generating enzyme family protein [Zunongwangia endophytica]
MLKTLKFCILFCGIAFVSCKNSEKNSAANSSSEDGQQTEFEVNKVNAEDLLRKQPESIQAPEGMVWVSGVKFTMGAKDGDPYALPREKPAHPVAVDGFFIDQTEVTNAQFKKFVAATDYITVAERPIDWEEIKKQVPPGTPKPADSVLEPGSMIFRKELENITNLNDYSQWWEWKRGANWKHPQGPESSIEGKDSYPVVHVAYEDALAYAEWADRDLPTEAEWEAAAYGQLHGGIYTWGDDSSKLNENANTWQGQFPVKNNPEDGYKYLAPVKSFPPNSLELFDMTGNVWEFTKDNFDTRYYKKAIKQGELLNPKGSTSFYNQDNPYQKEKVIKGGSFLCNKSYCSSYRISARMGTSMDSGTDHLGFRTVYRVEE